MKKLTLVMMALGMAAGCGGGNTPEDRADDVVALHADAANGDTEYQRLCATCHGADGAGGQGFPDLTAHVPSHSDEEIVIDMLEGPHSMPSFASQEDQTLADMLAFMRSEWGN